MKKNKNKNLILIPKNENTIYSYWEISKKKFTKNMSLKLYKNGKLFKKIILKNRIGHIFYNNVSPNTLYRAIITNDLNYLINSNSIFTPNIEISKNNKIVWGISKKCDSNSFFVFNENDALTEEMKDKELLSKLNITTTYDIKNKFSGSSHQ